MHDVVFSDKYIFIRFYVIILTHLQSITHVLQSYTSIFIIVWYVEENIEIICVL